MKLTPSIFVGLVVGLLLAVLAFSQAAASVGLSIDSFRPLGGSFFSWRAGQTRAALAISSRSSRVNSAAAQRLGRETLAHAPLTPRSLWLVGKSMEIGGAQSKARKAMLQAERLSRRDSAVQLWLGADRLRGGYIASGLRHFDLMIRGDADAANAVIPRMALIILAPEGRRHLAPYIRENNPWLPHLFQVAVTDLPRAAPMAQLLIDRRKMAPDIENGRYVYSTLLTRLIAEGSYSSALQLYPLLPGSNRDTLRNVGGTARGKLDEGYPPFVWAFSDGSAQGGEFVSVEGGLTGIDIFASPGTVGVAAVKLVAVNPGDALYWQAADRASNLDGSATWVATCLAGASAKKKVESANMLSASVPQNKLLKMAMPAGCNLVRLDMRVAGGIGRDPTNLTISALKLARDTSAK
ncbi:MAG: hypothetical protein ACREBX_18005 [Sphingopyxis sp.]